MRKRETPSAARPRSAISTPLSGRGRGSVKVINGYILSSVLGKGAFGTVYKGTSASGQETYAIKVIPKSTVDSAPCRERLQREIDVLAFLDHPNIAKLCDFFKDESNYYLVMEYCSGGELENYIVKNGKVREETAALLFQQVVSAVAYCHSAGIAHRDIKPENILISKWPVIKLSDFGLCGLLESDPMEDYVGSPTYCSPECLFTAPYDGIKADVWSLGVTLYTMVTGSFPWNIDDKTEMVDQIISARYFDPVCSPQAKDLISKMIQSQPRDRIDLDDALKHPWMKIAKNATAMHRPDTKIKLRKSVVKSKTNLVEKLKSKATTGEIESPFTDRV